MSTFVARPASPPVVRSTSFADLLPEGVSVEAVLADRVVFTADLDAVTVAAIRDRMVSADPAVLAQRAALRGARAAVVAGPSLENVAALVVAVANYQLGE